MKVFSNLAISLDGRIADFRSPAEPLGTPYDRQLMQVVRMRSDVIVIGAATLRVHPHTLRLKKIPKSQKRAQPANAIVTASGQLDSEWPFWKDPEVIRFVFTTDEGIDKAREAAQDRAFVVSCGSRRVSIEKLLLRLKQSDYQNVLVEGGGRLIGEFLSENLLQEMYVTHTPWILGAPNNPTLVDNPEPFASRLKLEPLKIKKIKNELYAHYKIRGSRRV
jgi:riboflavin-specific deaminase-like protein